MVFAGVRLSASTGGNRRMSEPVPVDTVEHRQKLLESRYGTSTDTLRFVPVPQELVTVSVGSNFKKAVGIISKIISRWLKCEFELTENIYDLLNNTSTNFSAKNKS